MKKNRRFRIREKHVMNLLPNEDGENQKCLIGEKEVDEVSELSEHGSCGSAILLKKMSSK